MVQLPDSSRDVRTDLLVTVACLYYELNHNQQEIADRLGISRSSVSRLIKEARDFGIVEIRIRRPVHRNYRLEQALLEHFELQDAYVLRTSSDQHEAELLAAVGSLAAIYLQRAIESMPPRTCIGIAWGIGVHAAVSALPEDRTRQIDVMQILGSVGAADPEIDGPDLARMLAGRLGGRHHDMHAPVFVEQEALREMLYHEPSVRDDMDRARSVALALTGIGTVEEEAASFLRAGHLSSAELASLRSQGVVGETVGRFFDAHGEWERFAINRRVVGIDLHDLRCVPRVLAVARGLPKVASILGALRGGYLTVLATDDITARAVLELASATAETRVEPPHT